MHSVNSRIQALALVVITMGSWGTAQAVSDPDNDPQIIKLIEDARHLIDSKNPTAAILKCDEVIGAFQSHYGNTKQKIYCARTGSETLGSLLKAAVDKNNAIALSSAWANAYFMKAYALQDLHRLDDAKAMLQLALKLSPFNSQYLAELGEIYALEKNWPKAKQAFQEAEDNASLAPDSSIVDELGRARRGLGYVFVELGNLDEAEKKCRQCLTANANDNKAKAELKYVIEQKEKQNAQ
jgi:tetratricopeptide (TPR) repeat protein